MTTLAEYNLSSARRLIGRDAVIRDDPYFGRRGKIARIIEDEKLGFLVAVHIYKANKNRRGEWEELARPPADARRFWAPEKVEIV